MIAESRRGLAREGGRWVWKVRLGLLLVLWSAPLLAGTVIRYGGWDRVGAPLTALNLPGAKLWGVPLARAVHGDELTAALMLISTAGVWLLTTSRNDPGERPLSLRRCLRAYAVIAVGFVWVILSPRSDRINLPTSVHPLATVLLVELPGTAMLYLYLAQLCEKVLRDPELRRRALRVLYGAAALQLVSVVAALGIVPQESLIAVGLLAIYLIAVIALGLYALDFMLDLYRAITREKLN